MVTALITGATSGIGAAFATELAVRGYDLVLVARDEQRLAQRAAELTAGHVQVETLSADLADPDACGSVEARCEQGIDLLVNNEGLGTVGRFERVPVEDEERTLLVNVRAVMRLTHAVLPAMLANGAGGVINVSSVGGYFPRPGGAGYAASKAWVTSFSESLHLLYAARGVKVLAVCPGFTVTEFHERAKLDVSQVPARRWLSPEVVVRTALRDLDRGRAVSVPGSLWKATVALIRTTPRTARFGAVAKWRVRKSVA